MDEEDDGRGGDGEEDGGFDKGFVGMREDGLGDDEGEEDWEAGGAFGQEHEEGGGSERDGPGGFVLGGLEEEAEGDPRAEGAQEVVDGFDFRGSRGGPIQRREREGDGGWESGALPEPSSREEEGSEDHEGEGECGSDAGGEFGWEVGIDGEGGGEDPGDELGLADIGLGEHMWDEVVVGVEHLECGDDSVSFGA